jgi:hypothetical protein
MPDIFGICGLATLRFLEFMYFVTVFFLLPTTSGETYKGGESIFSECGLQVEHTVAYKKLTQLTSTSQNKQ